MALLLLLFGGFWTQVLGTTVMVRSISGKPDSLVPVTSEALNPNSTISVGLVKNDPKEVVSVWTQTSAIPSSTPFGASEASPVGISMAPSTSTPVPEPATYQEISTKESLLPEVSTVPSDPAVNVTVNTLGYPTVTDRTMTFNSLETSDGTSGSVTMATSSNTISGSPVTTGTSSLEPSYDTHGGPGTTAAGSLETLYALISSPVSSNEISTMSTPATSVNTSTGSDESNGMLLVPVLVALLVVMLLVALLLLWRRRQKQRTGVLTLNRSGKYNGVVDAWAGPAQVPDEEAMTAVPAGGDKGSKVAETEASGQRPVLTTFFSRRKSHQGSLELEELKCGSGPSLKGEEVPLVGSEDEAVEVPTSRESVARDGAGP